MSNHKIIGKIESCESVVNAIASPSGGFVSSAYRTTLTVAIPGNLSKHLDLEKPIIITQED